MSLRVAEQETASRPAPRAVSIGAPSFAELVVFACLIGFGIASIVAQTPTGAHSGGFSPALLIGGWVVVFAALATLHAHDRRRRAVRPVRPVAAEPAASKRRPSPRSAAPRVQEVPPAPQARRRAVAEPAPRQAPKPQPSRSREVEPAPDPRSSLDRSMALSAGGRFAEAARAAHEGLANGEDPGPLLVALSRAHLARGQIDQAIETARDALFVSRSRDSVAHLIRVLTRTRRFGPEDGPLLRRAAARHPERAMLRHALGVFESMHGDAGAARSQLLAALQRETHPQERQAIERDLHRTQLAAS